MKFLQYFVKTRKLINIYNSSKELEKTRKPGNSYETWFLKCLSSSYGKLPINIGDWRLGYCCASAFFA
jgi:hypothetical protein